MRLSGCFVAISILASFICEDFTLAKARKTSSKSSKRSGSSKKNTKANGSSKRSGSSKKNTSSRSSKRSASSKSVSRNGRRAAGTNARRAASTAGRARASTKSGERQNSRESKKSEVENYTPAPQDVCPVNQLLRKFVDEDGNTSYYKSKKNTCSMPENVDEVAWDTSDPAKLKQYTLKKGWIQEDEAVSFACQSGNLFYKKQCKSFDDFCPLNEIIEKRGKEYINPFTDEPCVPMTGSVTSKVKAEENTTDIKNGMAYRFLCPDNSYTNTKNYIECLRCPSDTPYSKKGSNTSVKSCTAENPAEVKDKE